MSILPIIVAPDPRLKVRSEAVAEVDDKLRRLMDDMLETMGAAPGIGLSAVQVGVPKRVIVVDLGGEAKAANDDDERRRQEKPLYLVNPEIVWLSDETVAYEEGCLSLPEHYAQVSRPNRVRIRFRDYRGTAQELEADDLLATCIQHEIDHLEGILFVDHLSAVRRSIILRKLAKTRKHKLAAAG